MIDKTANDLARIAAYTHTLSQLCELSPHAEPIPLERLEVIFRDIAQVTGKASEELVITN